MASNGGKKKRRVWVIGGGLAGMTAAREIAPRVGPDTSIVILEADARLGGKAGSDRLEDDVFDHGYHVFPGWYANTLPLLEELGVRKHLHPIHQVHYITSGAGLITVKDLPMSLEGFGNVASNVFRGVAPWREMMLLLYAMFELANESYRSSSLLDQTTANGFLRSRLLSTERLAEIQQFTALQGSSIPAYELAATTLQKVARCWFRYSSPIFSMFDGDLQSRFIDPFEESLRKRRVRIRLETQVRKLRTEGGRITGLELSNDEVCGTADDLYVIATPVEVTVRFVDRDLFLAEDRATGDDVRLSDLNNLRTAPMAAMRLAFRKQPALADGRPIPREHAVFRDSRYLSSLIDVGRWWGLGRPAFDFIVSNVDPLRTLLDADPPGDITGVDHPAARIVVEEMGRFVPDINWKNIDQRRSYARFNLRAPLFLNTAGSWQYRPGTKTRLPNLYVAGDYCKTEIDLTTMESAVSSGLATANHVLRDLGLPADVMLHSLKTDAALDPRVGYPQLPLRLIQWAAWPAFAAIYCSLVPSGAAGEALASAVTAIVGTKGATPPATRTTAVEGLEDGTADVRAPLVPAASMG